MKFNINDFEDYLKKHKNEVIMALLTQAMGNATINSVDKNQSMTSDKLLREVLCPVKSPQNIAKNSKRNGNILDDTEQRKRKMTEDLIAGNLPVIDKIGSTNNAFLRALNGFTRIEDMVKQIKEERKKQGLKASDLKVKRLKISDEEIEPLLKSNKKQK